MLFSSGPDGLRGDELEAEGVSRWVSRESEVK